MEWPYSVKETDVRRGTAHQPISPAIARVKEMQNRARTCS